MADFFDIKKSTPCVSIIVTTYNRKILLMETINSIIVQSFVDFELIIIDNMSEDGTEQYINEISDDRIHYFRNPNNGIIAVNRNFGIQHAKGRYIAFCDDDDLWLPSKLEQQVSLLTRNSDVALCYTHAESFMNNKTLSMRMNRRNVVRNHFFELLRGNYLPNSSVLIRHNIFYELGLLTENPSLREDYEMWLRVARYYKIMGINTSLIRYRIHQSNVAGNRAKETLRAIRTVRSVSSLLAIPFYITWINIGFQYFKYFYYRYNQYIDEVLFKK
jgi:glycosyltransferase involved in cell wall biosynthesis